MKRDLGICAACTSDEVHIKFNHIRFEPRRMVLGECQIPSCSCKGYVSRKAVAE